MDRKWMSANRLTQEYWDGVEEFIRFAVELAKNPNFMLCPCVKCYNFSRVNAAEMKDHLIIYGIAQTYKCWTNHGETRDVSENSGNRGDVCIE